MRPYLTGVRKCEVALCERRLGGDLPGGTTRTSTSRARHPRISAQLLRIVYTYLASIQSYATLPGTLKSTQVNIPKLKPMQSSLSVFWGCNLTCTVLP